MRKLFVILGVLLSMTLVAQTKVAVYVTADSDIEMSMRKIFGSKLVAAIVQNKQYSAVERTSDFLNQLSKEQTYQMSGNVDDTQISELGKQFGVDYVCVAEVMQYKSSYYIQARLIDVETATIKETSEEMLESDELPELVRVAQALASNLVGSGAMVRKYGMTYSTCSTQKDSKCDILSVDNTGNVTKVTFGYVCTHSTSITISTSAYISDRLGGGKQYFVVGAQGIGVNSSMKVSEGIHKFTVSFQKMPESVQCIDIIEPGGWNWKQINLTPYGRENYFEFQDLTQTKYETAKQKELAAQQAKLAEEERKAENAKALSESVSDLFGTITDLAINSDMDKHPEKYHYYLKFVNQHSSPRKVYIAGKYIGTVGGYSTKTIEVPLNVYGRIESIQASGYVFSPNKESGNIPKQRANATFTFYN